MKPVLFEIFGMKIYGYGTMMAIGILTALLIVNYKAKKRGYDEDSILNMAILTIVLGVLGGKLLFIITEIKNIIQDPNLLKSVGNGFVVYGSIVGGALGVYIYCRRKKWSFFKMGDIIIPAVAIAQGFGRIGCFLAGCCYGRETNMTIGVSFAPDSLGPADIKVHPTQIYSSIFDFALGLLLLWYSSKKPKNGRVVALYCIIYSIGRFLVEFLRDDPRGNIWLLSSAQFIGIFVLILGIILFNLDKFKKVKIDEDQKSEEV